VDCEVGNVSTKIEWCKNKDGGQGKTWNPVTGCTKISPGCQNCYAERMAKRLRGRCGYDIDEDDTPFWPLPNVWLGVTAENQEMADKRIPILLQIPAAVRFVSVEPMLGPVDLDSYLIVGTDHPGSIMRKGIDWVICGGETGPDARPVHPDWVRNLRDQCQASGVPFFFKQWGEYIHASQTPDNMTNYDPEYFYDREWPPGFARVGKKIAGRLLDGCEWNEMPKVAQP